MATVCPPSRCPGGDVPYLILFACLLILGMMATCFA